MTWLQPVASANAPWTSTTEGLSLMERLRVRGMSSAAREGGEGGVGGFAASGGMLLPFSTGFRTFFLTSGNPNQSDLACSNGPFLHVMLRGHTFVPRRFREDDRAVPGAH